MRLWRVNAVEAVAITVTGFVLTAVLYPVWASSARPARGIVRGVNGALLAGAVLRFPMPDTGRIAEVTTDENGSFVRPDLRKVAYKSLGYDCVLYQHSTGGADTYVFSPRGAQEFLFTDKSGNRLSHLPVSFLTDQGTYHPAKALWFDRTTDAEGRVILSRVPIAARYLIQSNDKRWEVTGIGPAQGPPDALYARTSVALIPSE